jgi:hypothetical protein
MKYFSEKAATDLVTLNQLPQRSLISCQYPNTVDDNAMFLIFLCGSFRVLRVMPLAIVGLQDGNKPATPGSSGKNMAAITVDAPETS